MPVKTNTDTMSELIPIRVRRPDRDTGKGIFVSVNDSNFFIPYNTRVEVPRYIVEVIERSEEQDEHTRNLIETLYRQA